MNQDEILISLIIGTTNNEVVTLMKWASDMLDLQLEVIDAHENEISVYESVNKHQIPLVQWYFDLEETRRQIDDEAVVGKMLSGLSTFYDFISLILFYFRILIVV